MVRMAGKPFANHRVVAADGLRWMPGQTWSMDFDFRIGITGQEVDGIVAETVMERPEEDRAAILKWMHFSVLTTKLDMPDSFESYVEIRNYEDEVIAQLSFAETLSDRQTAAMWDLSRVYCGFNAPRRQLGLVCIDNISISSFQ